MGDTTVAIIGAGIGGIYLAAELGRRGCRLRLHDIDDSRLAPIRHRGGLDVEGENAGFAAIERVTTDPAAAVDGADIIAVCTGGTFQERVARGLAPLLRDGQTILLIQGNTSGALVVRRALDAAGCTAHVDIAEPRVVEIGQPNLGAQRAELRCEIDPADPGADDRNCGHGVLSV